MGNGSSLLYPAKFALGWLQTYTTANSECFALFSTNSRLRVFRKTAATSVLTRHPEIIKVIAASSMPMLQSVVGCPG